MVGACWSWHRKIVRGPLRGCFDSATRRNRSTMLRFRGIDPGRRYRVTFDNSAESCEVDGMALTRTGIAARLETALTSELLVVEAIS